MTMAATKTDKDTATKAPRARKPRAKKVPEAEWPYEFQIRRLDEMFVDDYQRPVTSMARKIEDQFDPALVGTLVVSERKDGRLALVDGNNRKVGMQNAGHETAPTLVYKGLTREQEASLFSRLQTERRGMTTYTRFRAALIAKDPEAVAIDALLRESGFHPSANMAEPGAIAGISALEHTFRRGGPALLKRVLWIINTAWGKEDVEARGAQTIRGIAMFIMQRERKKLSVDDVHLSGKLSGESARGLARRASALAEGRGSHNSPGYMADVIGTVYAKR